MNRNVQGGVAGTVVLDSAAYGPYAVGRREDGKVVLVRGGVPGDRVEVEAVRETSGMVEARIRRVLCPSPHRREQSAASFCAALDECGGCSWGHIRREAQVEFKREAVERILARLGAPPQVPLPDHDERELGYRQRARLHLAGEPGRGTRAGFFSHGTHDIVPISGCPVCMPELDEAIGSLSRFEPDVPFSGGIELVRDDGGRVLGALYLAGRHRDPAAMARLLFDRTSLAGCLVVSPHAGRGQAGLEHSLLTVCEEPPVRVPVHPGAFCQANRTMNLRLVRRVTDLLPGPSCDSGPGTEILELYAGHGNFSYPLAARGWRVTAVETGVRLDLLPHHPAVRFIQGGALQVLRRLVRRRYRPHAVLLDPPRTGARDVMSLLPRLEPQEIVYVSCDPNTFARDARELEQAGYRTAAVSLLDMMPHTHHVELVARLRPPGLESGRASV